MRLGSIIPTCYIKQTEQVCYCKWPEDEKRPKHILLPELDGNTAHRMGFGQLLGNNQNDFSSDQIK